MSDRFYIIRLTVDIKIMEPGVYSAEGSDPMCRSDNMAQNGKTVAAGVGSNAGTGSQDFETYYQQTEAENSRFFAEVADRKQTEAKERAERGS